MAGTIDPILANVEKGKFKKLAQPLKQMEYARAVSRKGLKGSGGNVGDVVLVVGLKVVPVKRGDPYLQRVLTLCALVQDGKHYIPSGKEDDETNVYLIDPRCLEKLPDDEQENYKHMLEAQYGKKSIN